MKNLIWKNSLEVTETKKHTQIVGLLVHVTPTKSPTLLFGSAHQQATVDLGILCLLLKMEGYPYSGYFIFYKNHKARKITYILLEDLYT